MRKKIVALSMAVLMLAVCVIGGTLAYFTDTADQTNTFTVGKVKLTLDETEVNGDGRTSADQTFTDAIVPGHSFTKDPTITIASDSQDAYVFLDITLNKYKSLVPVMALDAAADEDIDFDDDDVKACMVDGKFSTLAFLSMMADAPDTFRDIVDKWFVGIDHEDWELCGFFYNTAKNDTTVEGNWMTVRLAYIGEETMSANDSVRFMESFQMPDSVTQEMIENGLTSNYFNQGSDFQLCFTAYAIQADLGETDAFSALFGDDLGNFWHAV